MSRVAKAPVAVPNGVTVTQNGRQVEVKQKVSLSFNLHALVELKRNKQTSKFYGKLGRKMLWMQAGTARAALNNTRKGVGEGRF